MNNKDYMCIKECGCTTNYTCLLHRPNFFLGYSLKDILKKKKISYHDITTLKSKEC